MMTEAVKAFIGVGSNISPESNIQKAFDLLGKHVAITGVSTFYRTRPLLNRKQNSYLNGVWRIQTNVSYKELKLSILRSIESELHRTGTHDKYASRTIDLDVLLYGDLVIRETNCTLPDPDIYTRPFIAYPLFELDPYLIVPDTNTSIAQVIDTLSEESLIPDMKFTVLLKGVTRNERRESNRSYS